jgi:hypothetical protein
VEKNNMDTNEIIKQRIKVLPSDIKEAIKNADLPIKFDKISNKHGLHIDQSGALQTETLLVMIGLETTDNYVSNIQKALDISRSEAYSIADDINKEIFNSIRESLQSMQDDFVDEAAEVEEEVVPVTPSMITPSTPVTVVSQKPTAYPKDSIEKVGGFTIETPKPVTTPYKETNISKESILKSIEDAEVNMVDHLLTAPVSSTQTVEKQKVVEEKRPPKKEYATDPYREQI